MKCTPSQHLYWVLLLGVLSVVICEDELSRLPTTNAKSPLLRKYDIHRKPLKDEAKKKEFSQPPDDISSTTSVSLEWKEIVRNMHPNRTLDHLSRNTVPVVGPTEPTGKQNRLKGGSPGPGPLLAFKTMTTRHFADGGIDLPPTGWALASLKTSKNTISPGLSSKRPTTPSIKPISDYWSSRLAKVTTPSTFQSDSDMQQDATESNSKNQTAEETSSTPILANVTESGIQFESSTIKENISFIDNSIKHAIIRNASNFENFVKAVKPDVETSVLRPNISSVIVQNVTEIPMVTSSISNVENIVPDEANETKSFDQSTTSMTRPTNATQLPTEKTSTDSTLLEINSTTEKLSINFTTISPIDKIAETLTTIGNDIPDITQKSKKSNFTKSTPGQEENVSQKLSTEIITSTPSPILNINSPPTTPLLPFPIINTTVAEILTTFSNAVNSSVEVPEIVTQATEKVEETQLENENSTTATPKMDDDVKEETTIVPTTVANIKNSTLPNSIIEETTFATVTKDSRRQPSPNVNVSPVTSSTTTTVTTGISISSSETTTSAPLEPTKPYLNVKQAGLNNEVTEKNNVTTEETTVLDKANEIKPKITTILKEKSTTEIPLIKAEHTTVKSASEPTEKAKNSTEIFLSISNKNLTGFHYDLENKTESTPIIFRETVDIDDDDSLLYNTTSIEKLPHEGEIGDGDDEGEDLDKETEPGLSHTTLKPPTTPTSTKPTSTTQEPKVIPTKTVIPKGIPTDERTTAEPDESIFEAAIEDIPMQVELIIQAMYSEMCSVKEELVDAIVKLFKTYASRSISTKQVVLLDLGSRECYEPNDHMHDSPALVHLMMTDNSGQYSKTLTEILVNLTRQGHFPFKFPVNKVNTLISPPQVELGEGQWGGTVIAAIVISCIAAVSLLFLTILLIIMRKRQKGFNYGQRCTPVSLDDYSLDNISVYNSVRRKALRASKRSYGNPAFEDPVAISLPLNFAGLANAVSSKSKLEDEFSKVPMVTVKPDELPPGTETKNRYANVIPLPETRVNINTSTSNDVVDQFINANYVKGAKGMDKFYIACQAPLPNTIADFWQMVWEQQSKIIIMLTGLHENGVEKCADYLPPSEVLDCHRVFGDLQVTLKKREAREKYVISNLQLKNLETNSWREVTHMWYISWPARGIPDDSSSIIAFLIEARSFAKSGPPVVVHCSPGTGRTGTMIAIDIGIRDFETDRVVDIPKTVYNIRKDRAGAVQTNEQYRLIYEVLHLYATKLTGGGLDSI